MKATLITITTILFIAGSSTKISPTTVLSNQSDETNKIRKVRLAFGYLLLPGEYRASQTLDLRDAWAGYIASTSGDSIRIRYTAGLVESPFDHGKENFIWLKSETHEKTLLKFGLLKKEGGGDMAARVGVVNFYASVGGEAQVELFLRIVRSYRVKPCEDCEPVLPKPAIEQPPAADSR